MLLFRQKTRWNFRVEIRKYFRAQEAEVGVNGNGDWRKMHGLREFGNDSFTSSLVIARWNRINTPFHVKFL